MDLHTTRLKLTGLVGPSKLWDAARDQLLHLIVGDAVEIDLGLFESETTPVASVSNIELITWEVYENALAETLLLPAVTTDAITTVTLANWNAGTHQSATLALADTDTNLEMTVGARQAWAVIYATLTGGNRRVLGAGPIILQRSNAGGTGPAETPDELYPTNAEMAAFLLNVVKVNEAQSLTTEQKQQARTNISAASQSQIDQVSGAVDTVASDLAQEITDRENGDTATLAAAESYADAGDAATLATANGYTDDAITDLINGAPAALDTLLELAGALGDDPNFAATVAGQIGDNADAIEAEETARIAADLALNDDIEAEETARIAADAVLQGAIDDEVDAREAALTLPQLEKIIYPIIPAELDATYGDHFTGGDLNAKWTREGLVAGDHIYATGGGSWMTMKMGASTAATGKVIHQTLTVPTNCTIECRASMTQMSTLHGIWGIGFFDSSGVGIVGTLYSASASVFVATTSAWTYSSAAYVITNPNSLGNAATPAGGVWLRLRKAGTNYYFSYSLNGTHWSPESTAIANATTMTRIGFGLTKWISNSTPNVEAHLSIDYFNYTT